MLEDLPRALVAADLGAELPDAFFFGKRIV